MSKTVIDYLFKFSTKDENNHSLISNLQHTFFQLMNNIIRSDLPSANTEIIFSLIELAEMLSFPFTPEFETLFTKDSTTSLHKKLFEITSYFFCYFTLDPFFDTLTTTFSFFFFALIFIITFTIVFEIIVSRYFLSSSPCRAILKYIFIVLSSFMYIPIQIVFLLPYWFEKRVYRNVLFGIGLFFSIITLFMSIAIKSIMYDQKIKWTSINDVYRRILLTSRKIS